MRKERIKNRIPSSRIVYIIDNFNYLLYNIMGENNNIYYIYISPLIILYFYIKIKLNKKKRDSASIIENKYIFIYIMITMRKNKIKEELESVHRTLSIYSIFLSFFSIFLYLFIFLFIFISLSFSLFILKHSIPFLYIF